MNETRNAIYVAIAAAAAAIIIIIEDNIIFVEFRLL